MRSASRAEAWSRCWPALLLLSAIPHALLGWPPIEGQLRAGGADPGLIGGLSVGWHFGSVAMVALGAATLLAARDVLVSSSARLIPLCIGLAYTLFGLVAFLYRSYSLHFLSFIAIGALLVAGSLTARKAS